jgi:hypothetical protein
MIWPPHTIIHHTREEEVPQAVAGKALATRKRFSGTRKTFVVLPGSRLFLRAGA